MVHSALLSLVGPGLFLGFCLGLTGCSRRFAEEAPGKAAPTVTVS